MAVASKKEMQEKLTKAFTFAFAESQKRGIDIKQFHWFQNERLKDAAETKTKAA